LRRRTRRRRSPTAIPALDRRHAGFTPIANRIIEVSIAVRIFGVGGMLESFASKAAQETYGAHANALNAALAEP
jgi:hypothetical protein